MPSKPKRPCRHIGCTALTTEGYCEAHLKIQQEKRKEQYKNRPAYHSWYSTTRWKALRIQYLKAHPLCVECLKADRIQPSTVVDHKRPHRGNQVLFWDLNNFEALCKKCHDLKTNKEDGGFGNKVKH